MKTKSQKFPYGLAMLIYFSLMWQLSLAQPPSAIKHMNVFMKVASGDTTLSPAEIVFHSNTQLTGTMNLLLADTNYTTIHLKIGTTDGANDILDSSFGYTTGVYSNGTAFSPKGTKIALDIGSFTGVNAFYSEVYLQNSYGTSPVVKYAKK